MYTSHRFKWLTEYYFRNGDRYQSTAMIQYQLFCNLPGVIHFRDEICHQFFHNVGTMYAFFELENKGLKLTEIDGKLYMYFDNESVRINGFLQEWHNRQLQMQNELQNNDEDVQNEILKEYLQWEWTFPDALVEGINKEARRSVIQAQIQLLQDKLKALDED